MQVVINPPKQDWEVLCQRPVLDKTNLRVRVQEIMETVKTGRDAALYTYTTQLDGVELAQLQVLPQEISAAETLVSEELKAAMQLAKQNIEAFHNAQRYTAVPIETCPGVHCWRKQVPIEKVGIYVPGGSAPLFSTLLMLAIPALLAGCSDIVVCSPPNKAGKLHPAVLYAAKLLGIDQLYAVGGAQAIAAMTFGTESIPAVYKLFGPGNQYVTEAKTLAQQEGLAIDMPAGPSEVLVIADANANPAFVAADLLAQAEHGRDSQVLLLCTDKGVLHEVEAELGQQLTKLPRKELALSALEKSALIYLEGVESCMAFSNQYAPEHLILNVSQAEVWAEKVRNAGSVFLGAYSCESAGDYASGTNHTLPTNGAARAYSGVSLESFCKTITLQQLSAEGVQSLGSAVELMAEAEGLEAHKNAMTLRMKSLRL